MAGLPGVLNSRTHPPWASSKSSMEAQVVQLDPLPAETWTESALPSTTPWVHLSDSLILGALPCHVFSPLFLNLRRVFGFSVMQVLLVMSEWLLKYRTGNLKSPLFWYWGLNPGPTPWVTHQPFFVIFFFQDRKTGSWELFAWAGFKLWFSWPLPPG
jgi:hypothetical protein